MILMTPDDEGALVGETPQKRPRQNVVFELGFFIGKLGTPNVAGLVKGHIEKPSDFDGIGYIDFDAKGEWKKTPCPRDAPRSNPVRCVQSAHGLNQARAHPRLTRCRPGRSIRRARFLSLPQFFTAQIRKSPHAPRLCEGCGGILRLA